MLTREKILQSEDRVIRKVDVPEWNDFVYVRSLSGTERDQFEEENLIRERDRKHAMMTYDVRLKHAKARLVALSVCDDQGNRLFNDTDIEALGLKNAAAIDRLYSVGCALSGIGDQDIDDLIKN